MDALKRASFRKTYFGCTCEYCGGVNRVTTQEARAKLKREDKRSFGLAEDSEHEAALTERKDG